MKIKQHIPNVLTMGNLVCGCIGIVYSSQHNLHHAAYFVWMASVFDFFDGYVARFIKVSSELGKQLDSLADMVSFGVLPAMVAFAWLNTIAPNNWLAYSAFLIAVCAALRLGRFNIDEQQQYFFIGLPTPANTLFITGLIFLPPPFSEVLSNTFVLLGIVILFSLLMVMPIRLFSLKTRNLSWKTDKILLIFITLSILLLGFQQAGAISLIVVLYILLSLVKNWSSRKKISNNS